MWVVQRAGDLDPGGLPRGPAVTRSDNGACMPRFSPARAFFASCTALAVVAFSALPAFAAATLNSVRVDIGFESGLCIVVLAVILDRVCRPRESREG